MDLPPWIDADAWAGYVAMRKSIKKPLTERAMKLAIHKLEGLLKQGHDPTKVLDQSTFNSWQGLFPIREERHGRQSEDPNERLRQAARNIGYNPKLAN